MQRSNFEFLKGIDDIMFRTALAAEKNLHEDANTTLIKLRMFAETCAKALAAKVGIDIPETQINLINSLSKSNIINPEMSRAFHQIRILGNDAVHKNLNSAKHAKLAIHLAHHIAFWYYKLISKNFSEIASAFVEPKVNDDSAYQSELTSVKEKLAHSRQQAATTAEAIEAKESNLIDLQGYVAILESQKNETEQQAQAQIASLEAQLEKQQQSFSSLNEEKQLATIHEFTERAAKNKFELTEQETRFIIDGQLELSGWTVDSENLRHSKGTRPEKGKNMAIAEWPTQSGPADYVLFIGLQPVAIVEAKKKMLSVQDALPQAKRYADDFDYQKYAQENELVYINPNKENPSESRTKRPILSLKKPTDKVTELKQTYEVTQALNDKIVLKRIAFLYSANGREYLQQVKTQSGIWFANASGEGEHVLAAFHSPDDLSGKINTDKNKARQWLQDNDKKDLDLFAPSEAAVDAVENTLLTGQETMLVAMATGTGKTRVAGATMYRLLTSGLCRNALFLVDRRSLGTQAVNAFKEYRIRQLPLADHYNLYELGESVIESGNKPWIQITTVQSLSLMLQSDNNPLTPGMYDCIIVDEAHRGYNEDVEQSEGEMLFRDQREYQSKYRQVLDYFDAIKIGLTATPATNTVKIFGKPIYEYRFAQAVMDGRLVDQEPPIIIETELSKQGIQFEAGANIQQLIEGEIIDGVLPEEVNVDITGFNKRVLVPEFNRAVCDVLPQYIDPTKAAKTLVFCVNDIHAEEVVSMLRDTYRKQLGDEVNQSIIKITGKSVGGDSKQIESLISRYRKERLPNIVVTVDLLTTGIDVKPISNLVFLRQVKSRILYEQMKGRATRICDDINKQTFRIFDAVNLTSTIEKLDATQLMKPVVTRPNVSLEQLVDEMGDPATNDHQGQSDESFAQESLDAFTVKLSRTINKANKLKLDKEGVASELAQLDALVADKLPEVDGGVKNLAKHLHQLGPMAAAKVIKENGWILNKMPSLRQAINFGERAPLIYDGDVGDVTVTQNWGDYQQPEEYLVAFERFITENVNKLSALDIVVNRPRDLTKKDLVALMSELESHKFNEQTLIQARKAAKQEDIAARIIGFVRQAAIGCPLISFQTRLEHAQDKIIRDYQLQMPQVTWLKRIINQMKEDLVLNDDSFKKGTLKTKGGKNRADLALNGQLDEIMKDLIDATWGESA
ncbi:MAG: type I restriction enzyme R subunit [Alteromonadaceae bacterium]|jgi:type I restriction enzyme R subunit